MTKKKNTGKRRLSMFLILSMCLSIIATPALAETPDLSQPAEDNQEQITITAPTDGTTTLEQDIDETDTNVEEDEVIDEEETDETITDEEETEDELDAEEDEDIDAEEKTEDDLDTDKGEIIGKTAEVQPNFMAKNSRALFSARIDAAAPIKVSTAEALQKAINEADENATIELEGTIEITTAAQDTSGILINGKNITLYGGESGAVISSKADMALHGIQIYGGSTVNLQNLTITDFGKDALLVNGGSTVTATNLTTSDNTWGAVNVDHNSNFTLVSGNLGESSQIWIDDTESQVTVPDGWYKYQYQDTNHSNVQKFFTSDADYENKINAVAIVEQDNSKTYYEILPLAMEAIQSNQGDATITLLENAIWQMNGTVAIEKAVDIDLDAHTLSITDVSPANGITVQNGGNLTLRNGSITAENVKEVQNPVIEVTSGSSVTLNQVTFSTNGVALYPRGDAAKVSVIASEISAPNAYAVATNAGTTDNYNVVIELKDSTFNGNSPILINVPGTLTMDNCEVAGVMHGVIVRGGTAEIKDSTITQEYTGNETDAQSMATYFQTNKWAQGNTVPLAAITIGNKGTTAYKYPSNVTLINTKVTTAGAHQQLFPDMYVYVNEDNAYGVTLTTENCTFGHDNIVYAPENDAVAMIAGGTQLYTTLADAIAAANVNDTVTLLKDVTIDKEIRITKDNITLNGNGKTITVQPKDNAEVRGIQVWKATGVAINDLTITGATKDALLVNNGSSVTATRLTTKDNAWGAVNVDKGSTFSLGEGCTLNEANKVWADDASTVNVPEGWNTYLYKDTNSDHDTQTFYAPTAVYVESISDAVVEQDETQTYYETLPLAMADVQEGATVTLLKSVTISQEILITKDGITLNSNGNSKVITVNGENTRGIQVYGAKDVKIDNLTITGATKDALLVNGGASVTATNLTTSDNAWGAVNVDHGSVFNLVSGNLSEDSKIWIDDADSQVTVPADWHYYRDTAKNQIFYAPDLSISLNQTTASLYSNTTPNTVTLTATTPANAAIAWSSSDESVATVENGVVTSVGNGTAIITATVGDMTATCTVTVTQYIASTDDGGYDYGYDGGYDYASDPANNTTSEGTSGGSTSGSTGTTGTTNTPTVEIGENGTPLADTPTLFDDVASDAWYHDVVADVVGRHLMGGVAERTFAPTLDTSRAMLVTMLHRLEGAPSVEATTTFADVPADEWFAAAVNWAAANNIVHGYSEDTFAPNDAVTREQLAAILYGYSVSKGYDVTQSADLTSFADSDQIGDWAVESMRWAVATGLIKGVDADTLNPGGTASRAEVAAIMSRFCAAFVK